MTTSRFEFISTPLSGLTVIRRKPIEDDRGFFCRFYCAEEFRDAGLQKPVAQINHTFTRKKGAVRGLHFQYPPYAEAKIVSCLKGEIYDVAVDIRCGSPTFLCWHAEILSADNCKSLLIPEGFAHGFLVLSDTAEFLYKTTDYYAPEFEKCIIWNDVTISVNWPLKTAPSLSSKDLKGLSLVSLENSLEC